MQQTNGKRHMQLTPQQQQQQSPAIQQPAVPMAAMILAQMAPLVGPISDAEILQEFGNISPAQWAGEMSIETEIVYYEED